MRFTKKKDLMDAYYDSTRMVKTKFLWWPLTIRGETRWLETATIEYHVEKDEYMFFGDDYYWSPWQFVNK